MESVLKPFEAMTHGYNLTCYEQLKDYIYKYQEPLFCAGEERRASISSAEELKSYNKEMREKYLESIGGMIDTTGMPLNARSCGLRDYGDYTIEAIIFESRPHVYVTGSFYLPKNLKTPSAAVLFVCGHGADGRLENQYQMVCQTLCAAGLIVFAIDPLGQGERANFYDPETKSFKLERCCPDHDAIGIPGMATGKFLERYFLCDEMRAIDYMLTRPEIDPKRIGVTGNSGGGTQTCAMMLVDDRIAAAAPGTFLTNRREYMYAGQAQDAEQVWPGMTEYGLDHANPLLMMCPRPAAILAVNYDFFPIEGTISSYNEAKRLYELLNVPEKLVLYRDDDIHNYSRPLARCSAAFFSRELLGEEKYIDNTNFQGHPLEELQATKSGQVTVDFPDALRVLDEIRLEAEALRIARAHVTKESIKKWLREQADMFAYTKPLMPRIFPKTACVQENGYMGTSCRWWSQERLYSYGVMLKKDGLPDIENRPVSLAVWNGGTKRLSEHEDWILKQIDAGRQVFVLDVAGMGELEQRNMVINCDYETQYGTLYTIAINFLYAGKSLCALRLHDVLRCLDMLNECFGVSNDDISIYADGSEGVYALMAGFMNDMAVERGPKHLEGVEKSMIQADFRYENTYPLLMPGMLKYFDYNEL